MTDEVKDEVRRFYVLPFGNFKEHNTGWFFWEVWFHLRLRGARPTPGFDGFFKTCWTKWGAKRLAAELNRAEDQRNKFVREIEKMSTSVGV